MNSRSASRRDRQKQRRFGGSCGLVRAGRVVKLPDKRFALPDDEDHVAGRILMNRRGGGRVLTGDASQSTIDIPPNSAGTAMHNDRVLVLVNRDLPSPRRGGRVERLAKRPRGKVVKVVERARTQVVGALEKSRQLWFIVPNDPNLHDIYLPKRQARKRQARRGDKVVVEITEWPSRHNAPEGRLVEVLGSASSRAWTWSRSFASMNYRRDSRPRSWLRPNASARR